MIKSIFVPVVGSASDRAALDAAFLVAGLFDAHIACSHTRPNVGQLATRAATGDLGTGFAASELFEALKEQVERRAKLARETFDRFVVEQHIATSAVGSGGHRVTATFKEVTGDEVADPIAEARFHDMTVLCRSQDPNGFDSAGIGSLLIGCGRPVLIAPEKQPQSHVRTIAIAWRETAEAARAVTAAMPLLTKADLVLILTATEEGDELAANIHSAERIAVLLREHGISAQARCVVPGGQALAAAIMETAVADGADLLVMGAYGHSRLREYVFGGVTRAVLDDCSLSVLLFH